MQDVAKILGWTIAGAVFVAFLDSSHSADIIKSLLGGWGTILQSFTGGQH